MKVQINHPWSAEKEVGCTVQHYGVDFTVVESSSKSSLLVADLPEEEAQAMIDAGRVTEVDEEDQGGVSIEEMKSFLAEKGVSFAANIGVKKLTALYAAELAKG